MLFNPPNSLYSIQHILFFSKNNYRTGAFLDVSQSFDGVLNVGFLFKLKLTLPFSYYLLLKSYLEDHFFLVYYGLTTFF